MRVGERKKAKRASAKAQTGRVDPPSRAGGPRSKAGRRQPPPKDSAAEDVIAPPPDSLSGLTFEEGAAPSSRSARPARPRGTKRALFVGAALLSAFVLVPFEPHVRERMASLGKQARARFDSLKSSVAGAPPAAAAAALTPSAPAGSDAAPADAPPPTFRPGRGPLGGGVFSLPPDLRVGPDGQVDVLIHFHGNTDMVLESVEHAKLGAATVVVNLGVGSGPYEERFDNPVAFLDLLTRTEGAIEKRGIPNAKLGRIALSSWSAGYGAILRILKNDGLASKIDSVVLLDGMHVGYREDGALNWMSIDPFQAFAERAVRGETLFVVTHSNIEPVDYLGVKETSDHLLEHFGIVRTEVKGVTVLPPFESFKGVLPKAEMIPLTRATEAQKGNFIVRGFRGNEPHTHMAHLMEMSQIGLPDLARRWKP